MKQCGQKNELSWDEKTAFESKLKNKFEIVGQIGISGVRTSAYLLRDSYENRYILKIPNNYEDKAWIVTQQKAYESCAAALRGYCGDVYIPKMLMMCDDYIVEEYAGEELTPALYFGKLTKKEQKHAAEELAKLLANLHYNNPTGAITPNELMIEPTLDMVFDYMRPALDKAQLETFQTFIYKYQKRDTSDEICVLTHGDLRYQNVLYDNEKKRLAVIDFELLKPRNIYHDFIPGAAACFGMPYIFLWDTVDAYNMITGRKSIDIEKVKLMHYLGILHELGRCALAQSFNNGRLRSQCQEAFSRVAAVQ